MKRRLCIIALLFLIIQLLTSCSVFIPTALGSVAEQSSISAPPSQAPSPSKPAQTVQDGALEQQSFGTYSLPEHWMFAPEHSTDEKFFYIKDVEPATKYPTNISVEYGTNKYPVDDPDSFKRAILSQLSMQVGKNEIVTGNGSYTEQGYPLYTFGIESPTSTTTQYYIVGDYQYILIHLTDFQDPNIQDATSAANHIVDSFRWADET